MLSRYTTVAVVLRMEDVDVINPRMLAGPVTVIRVSPVRSKITGRVSTGPENLRRNCSRLVTQR